MARRHDSAEPAIAAPALTRVGHKGADRLAPGNTAQSFDAALAAGVDMVEFDVLCERYRDRGGRLLLAHDYGDLRGRKPITLEEGLDHLVRPEFARVRLDVDMKLGGYEDRVIAALCDRGLERRALISTMERTSLRRVRELAPDIRLGWSFPRVRRDYTSHPVWRWPAYGAIAAYRRALPGMAAGALARGEIDALMCHWAFVGARLWEAVRDSGGELYVWTVDDPERIMELARIGVTGVITNDPRLFGALGPAPATS